MSSNRTDLFVFGTSILWGQGHNDSDKIHQALRKWLTHQRGERVGLYHDAHSGALLRSGPGRIPSRLDGEIPTGYPAVQAQIARAVSPRSSMVRVLIDGGINGVGVANLLNPFISKARIRKETRQHCYVDLLTTLREVAGRFAGADVYVLGYYQILADYCTPAQAAKLLGAFGFGGFVLNDSQLLGNPIANTRLFWQESTRRIKQAVREANRSGGSKFIFVDSGFKPSEGVFGRRSLLFSVPPRDPKTRHRASVCGPAICSDRTETTCYIAAAGHPNKGGVKRYVRQIKQAILAHEG